MKKLSLVVLLGVHALLWHSCTRTCTCIDPNNKIKEIEIPPDENCSDRSGASYGECS